MTSPEQANNAGLKSKAVKGGAVTLVAQMVTVLVQLASIIILSRLLPPEDFGIIAMIMAVIAFMMLFRDMGLSTASIQKGHLEHDQITVLFWLNVVAGLVLSLLVLAFSPVIAWFYDRPELQPVCALLSLSFLFTGAGVQHAAMMQRELRFKPKAIADVAGAVTNLLVAAVLALRGFGYWSLAWGTVSGALVTTSLYLSLGRFTPGVPRRANGIREMLGFGANVTGFEIVNYFSRNLDNILLGRIWGATTLGMYSRAYQMMMMPINSLRTPINAVAFPVLSRLRNEPAAFRRYYCRVASMLAFLSMPLMAFLAVNAENVVIVSIGEQWRQVIPIFVLLGLTGFIQPVASLRGMVLLSLGRSRRYLGWGVFNALAVCVAVSIGVAWGAQGVALAYAISNYVILYPSLLYSFRDSPLKPSDFFSTIALPFFASILAVAVNYSALGRLAALGSMPGLVSAFMLFTTTYVAFFFLLPAGRKTLRSYLDLLHTLSK